MVEFANFIGLGSDFHFVGKSAKIYRTECFKISLFGGTGDNSRLPLSDKAKIANSNYSGPNWQGQSFCHDRTPSLALRLRQRVAKYNALEHAAKIT